MGVDDLVRAVVEGLVPPDGTDAQSSKRWRRYHLTVSGTILGMAVMNIIHIAWACGWLTSFGMTGFALASDVSQHQAALAANVVQQGQALAAIQVRQIQRELRDAKTQLCLAQQSKNGAALYSWSNMLEQARGSYFSVTRTWPQVQSCEELVIAGQGGNNAGP